MGTEISGSTGIDKIQNNAVDIADLSATGTASASTFLRGDNAWSATPITALNNATENELVTVGATTTELDAEANLTFDGTDLTLGTGDIVFGTAGKGICLGVTSNTDANTLDDYEEGTWTPTLDATGGSISVSYSANAGYYTKIGNSVHITFNCIVSSHSGGSGAYRINGLPFAASNPGGSHIGISTMAWENHPITSGKEFQQVLDSGKTYIRLKQASWENYTPDSNCSIYMSFHYMTS